MTETIDRAILLDDEAVANFIMQGYLLVETDFPPEFHEQVYRDIERVFASDGNPGNRIYETVPSLREVYEHPRVVGALTSLLGRAYRMNDHRHCHVNDPEVRPKASVWHQDDVNFRGHRLDQALAMYYPQDVPQELGPTVILPGTQYHNTPTTRMRTHRNFKSQVALCVKAGTVAIAHYDIWHSLMRNHGSRKRFMLKFIFNRTEEPTDPSWNADPDMWAPIKQRLTVTRLDIDDQSDAYKHSVLWMQIWNWLHGKAVDQEETVITHFP
jgi:hypothetical protein